VGSVSVAGRQSGKRKAESEKQKSEKEKHMRSIRPVATARRVLAASTVALTLAIGIGANAPIASAGVPGCSWQPLTLVNSWHSEQNAFGTGDPSYCLTSDGMVYLSGSMAGGNGDEFAVLPSYAAPAHLDYLSVYTLNGTLGFLRIDPDGSMHAYGSQSAQFTSLAGVSFLSAVTEQGMMPLLNSWQSAQSAYLTGDPAYYVSGGIVHLDGSVYRPIGPPLAGSTQWTFAVLPSTARTTEAHNCFSVDVYTYLGGTADIFIGSDGSINAANGSFTSLAGVSYPTAPATWHSLTLLNGENGTGLCLPLSYYISQGVVYLAGFLEFPPGFNGEFAVLPPGARPAHTMYLNESATGEPNLFFDTVRIDPDGGMYVFNSVDGNYFVDVSGLSYHLGS
jgi:hypothetical protein